jgi:LysR family transcriptional activator of mexEF-oprN operon
MIAAVPDYAACALVEGGASRAEDPPFPINEAQLSLAWSGVHVDAPAEQ